MKSVLTVSALVSFILLLGRLSGFLRETLLAAAFGPTMTADAAIVLLTLPDLMVGLLLAGGFNAVLIPAIKRAEGSERIILVRRAALVIAISFTVLALILAMVPDQAMGVFAPSLEDGALPNLQPAFQLSLIALPMVAVIGVAAAYLNSIGRFAIPNLSVLIFNIMLCGYLLMHHEIKLGLVGFALTILVASFLRLGLHLVFMRAVFQRLTSMKERTAIRTYDGNFVRRFSLGVLGLGVTVAAPIAFRTLYAATGEGKLALFSFALKLFELPSAILIAPMVIVMIPKLAATAASEARAAFNDAFKTALLAGITLAIMAVCIALTFADPITRAIYGYGAMGSTDVERVSELGVVLILGLPFLVAVQLGAAGLSAQGQMWELVICALVCLGVTMAAVALLQALVGETQLPFAAMGLVAYNALLAGCYIFCLFGLHLPTLVVTRQVGWILLRSIAAILPFAAAMAHWGDTLGRWGGVGLAVIASIVLLLANPGPLLALRRLEIDNR